MDQTKAGHPLSMVAYLDCVCHQDMTTPSPAPKLLGFLKVYFANDRLCYTCC